VVADKLSEDLFNLLQGCRNPGRQVAVATKFCAVTQNICVFSTEIASGNMSFEVAPRCLERKKYRAPCRVVAGVDRMVRPLHEAGPKGRKINILNGKIFNFLHSTNFQLLRQIHGHSMNDFDFFSKSVIFYRIGNYYYSPRVSKNLATPLQPCCIVSLSI
jgi:hypothetical protein